MLAVKKRFWIEIVLHLVFWTGVLYVLTSLDRPHIQVGKVSPLGNILRGQYVQRPSAFVYMMLGFLMALFYGNIFWVFRKALRHKNGIVRLALCFAWLTMVFGADYFMAGPLFDQAYQVPKTHGVIMLPVRHSPADAINFRVTDWWHVQPVLLLAFLVIEGIAIAYFFLKEWAKSELLQLSTENKFLRSQVNPHFLFNTLNNLFSLAQREGKGDLADKIAKLSGMMRYMIYESNTDRVPLASELSYLEDCIVLHQMRYAGDEAAVTLHYPEPATVAAVQVAPMLFIPFLENAFKHGVAIGRHSSITLSITVNGNKLVFTCENTDHSSVQKLEEEQGGIGLENVRRRLELVYPGRHQLRACQEDGKYIVNLQIDLS